MVKKNGIHAFVPVNLLRRSKARLSSLLVPVQRENLTLAMLKDVLRALRKSKEISDVTVVSPDLKIMSIVRGSGAQFLQERTRHGLNRALTVAMRTVMKDRDRAVLIVHADLPLLKTREVNELIAKSKNCEAGIAPCKKGRGTNALFLRHPDAIPISFGRSSFKKHLSHVRRRKLRYKVVRFTGFQFDVDEPEDLQLLMRGRVAGETERFLATLRCPVERKSAANIDLRGL